MKKIVFIIVRYSVLLKSKSWNISRESDFDDYRKNLFSKERLDQHFYFFEHVMLPSVANQVLHQEEIDVKLLIITSELLPDGAKQDLSNAISGYLWADTIFMKPEGNLNREINSYVKSVIAKQEAVYATVRLDDDDALHSNFLTSLSKYLTASFSGHVVSYPRGYAVLFDSELRKIVSAIELYYPKNAQGMALINSYNNDKDSFFNSAINIFQTGKHTTVHERYPLILDESMSAYLRMCYKSQDTAEKFFRRRKKVSEEVLPEKAFHGFEVNIPLANGREG